MMPRYYLANPLDMDALIDHSAKDDGLKLFRCTPQRLAELDAEGYVIRQPDGSIMIGTEGAAWK